MAIDVNEEVRVWGGFSPQEFWLGCAALMVLAGLSLLIGIHTAPLYGGISFFVLGGSFTGFMVYRQGLPQGYLSRRFLQDGTFLFLKVPGVHGVDVYLPPAFGRGRRFDEAMGERNAGR